MEIILVRHAVALDKDIAKAKKINDADRELTSAGKKKFKKHVLNYVSIFKKSDCIISSPYRRAEQTAKILADSIPFRKKIVFSSLLAPQGSAEKLKNYLKPKSYRKLILVSHEPLQSLLIKSLTGIALDSVHLKKGSLVVLRLQLNGTYKLYQLLNP